VLAQEIITFIIVSAAFGAAFWMGFKKYLAAPLSRALLKRNQVKLAFWLQAKASGCNDCHCEKGTVPAKPRTKTE